MVTGWWWIEDGWGRCFEVRWELDDGLVVLDWLIEAGVRSRVGLGLVGLGGVR